MGTSAINPKDWFMDDTAPYDPVLIKDIKLSDETVKKLEEIFLED